MKTFPPCFLLFVGLSVLATMLPAKNPYFGSDLDTPLNIAAADGNTARVTALLDKGEPVDGRDSGGRTPLMTASIAGMTDVVRLLLARHADPNQAARSGKSPLDFAIGWDHNDIVPLLLEAGADPNGFREINDQGETWSPLFAAVVHESIEPIKLLLAHGARIEDRNNRDETAVMEACKRAATGSLTVLIEHGANVNAHDSQGFTGLIYACYNGREEVVRLTLAKGADVHAVAKRRDNSLPWGPLEAAQEGGQPFVLEALAAAGATPARPKAKLTDDLDKAITWGKFEAAQALIARGAPVNEVDNDDRLPLDLAILMGDPGFVQLLLKAGADVNSPLYGPDRQPPLACAEERRAAQTDPEKAKKFQRIIEILRQAHAAQ